MIKEPYTEKFYSYYSKYIYNALALREPQYESLEIFARLCDVLSLKKNPVTLESLRAAHAAELAACGSESEAQSLLRKWASEAASDFYQADLAAVRALCPAFTSFERDFPSVCFALATGIGKTRLMGACIAYLHYEKHINNFFVMAPSLTIYEKLRADLGDVSNPKYVFRGLDAFVTAPRIIDGENYMNFRMDSLAGTTNEVTINVFNISKLNTESKVRNGAPARIRRLSEVLGESYFSYLQSLDDLCIFMDESHHYHADKSFEVINELRPILGVELTATPQVQKGTRKVNFKNVIYEYSLAHALNDEQYVKVPVVVTRKNFRPEEYTPEQLDREKLNDGIRIHEDTKSQLELYARTYGKRLVKPFVLVVAKDTAHSRQIREYLTSDEFFHGYYRDKVLEINSAQRGAEKDENIEKLLALEKPDNRIEIVIHVNMLKEGWDVTNLYTIIPLRASASETLTEQTLGRGLRLPYGMRTGIERVDQLSIVHHDNYAKIVDLAKDPNSLVRKVYYIDDVVEGDGQPKETVEMPSVYEEAAEDKNFLEQLSLTYLHETPATYSSGEPKTPEQAAEITHFVAQYTARSVMEMNKQVTTYNAAADEDAKEFVKNTVIRETLHHFSNLSLRKEDLEPVVRKSIETCVQALTDKVIPIPRAVVQPYTEVKRGFYPFKMDTRNMNWHPGSDVLIGTELREGGRTFEYNPDVNIHEMKDTPENEIVRHLVVYDDVDYQRTADLLYSLVGDAKAHFLTYLSEKEAERVMRERQKTIAEMIYSQMKAHFRRDEKKFKATSMRPFSRIEANFGTKYQADQIFDLRAHIPVGEVRSKIFTGFHKACHRLYKFDSNTERIFAMVLENDKDVQKWLRPAPRQFELYYDLDGEERRYEPDFVVETEDQIFMVEVKARNEIFSRDVQEKTKAAQTYCLAATEWNAAHEGKPWTYVLIPHDEVRLNSGFLYLVKNSVYPQQQSLIF